VLWIPWLGKAIYHLSICRYAKAFSMLYRAGVPISECTERATVATGNVIVAQLFEGGIASVRAGGMACDGFSKRLPTEYRQLWQIGEESGELDRTVDKIAEVSAYRADQLFTTFAFWLPRIIYFIILGVMAMMIVQLWTEIYSGLGAF
jgi:type II secretory pathway component PulF